MLNHGSSGEFYHLNRISKSVFVSVSMYVCFVSICFQVCMCANMCMYICLHICCNTCGVGEAKKTTLAIIPQTPFMVFLWDRVSHWPGTHQIY